MRVDVLCYRHVTLPLLVPKTTGDLTGYDILFWYATESQLTHRVHGFSFPGPWPILFSFDGLCRIGGRGPMGARACPTARDS